MSVSIFPKAIDVIATSGRQPPVALIVSPLDKSPKIRLDRFLTYRFNSSIIIPVDTFDFTFCAPDDEKSFYERVKDGDIVSLQADGKTLATGLVDAIDIEVDRQFGEKIQISGRDLMAQLEDQDAISIDDKPMWANAASIDVAIGLLVKNTRIRGLVKTSDAPKRGDYLFATEPGESKLAALQRFLEPLNCLAWMTPDGKVKIGRPNMAQRARGTLILSKDRRQSNVISMAVRRASTNIPNIMLPIWSGQENVQDRIPPEQRLLNKAKGPNRLYSHDHRVPKSVVVSSPQGSSAQELSDVNRLRAGSANLLQSYAKREIARANMREMIVEAVVPGHYDQDGNAFLPDTVFKIEFDRGSVDENMYLFEVQYEMTAEKGQSTVLRFCRLGSIVSDVRAP